MTPGEEELPASRRTISSQAGQSRITPREQAAGLTLPPSAAQSRGAMERSGEHTWRGTTLPGPSQLGGLEERGPKEVLSHIGMAPQGLGRRPTSRRSHMRDPVTSG